MDIIKVEKQSGQAKAKQLRRSGLIPCCVYGGSLAGSVSIQMRLQDADYLFRTKRVGSKVNLDLEGRLIPVQIKEKKKNHLNTEIEHISFQALAAEQRVNSVAHIFLRNADVVPGVLEQMIFEVPFSSLPADMIDTVTIDLEGLPAGTILTVDDIPEFRNEGVEVQIKRDSMVLRISDKKRAQAIRTE